MPREEKIAGLRTVLAGGADRSGGGDGPLLCLLHGYGASGDDLAGLWRVLDVPRATRFAFPEAPISLSGLFGFPSYAWWHVDVARFSAAQAGGVQEMARLMDEEPEGMAEARAAVTSWLLALQKELGVASERVVLGGFSQGAMLATDVALHLREGEGSLAGLCLLSGALVNRAEWQERLPLALPAPRFQSHGTVDPILPFAAGEALHHFLQAGPYPGDLHRFHGGHEIPAGIIEALGPWLTKALGE